jgi:GntR family transcriptional regulator
MLLKNSNIPLYLQIKSSLISMMNEMKPSEMIPSEPELSKNFGVSRGTVKQAIVELVHEGLLYRIQGKGTFVSPPKIKRSFRKLPSFTDDIKRLGYKAVNRLIGFDTIKVPIYISSKLLLPAESSLYRYSRLVCTEDAKLAIVTSYIRTDLYPDFSVDKIESSLYESLIKYYGQAPSKADDTYMPVNATTEQAEYLNVKVGTAIFYSERTAYLDNDLPVEFVESYIRGDNFILDISISPNAEQTILRGESSVSYFSFGSRNFSS